jgi:putative chitinase
MALALTREILVKLAPRPSNAAKAKIWDGYVEALTSDKCTALLARFDINSHLRLAHLLSQWLHECSGFTLIWESGAYSAKRIVQIFGVGHHSARVTAAEASRLAYNGPALFERVYGLGNPKKARELGNTEKGDGWRYRGCGILQITGRAAHERYAEEIGCAVEDLEKPINAIHAALLEWGEKHCNLYADKDDVLTVTRRINGGTNGLAERRAYLARAKRVLGALEHVPAPAEGASEEEPAVEEPSEAARTSPSALVRVSRKARTLDRIKKAMHGVWASLTLASVLEYLGLAKSTADQVSQFVHEHAVAILITGAILILIAVKYVMSLMAEDVDEGRAVPSGEAA